VELEIPLGFRRELTQVRNSEMGLARERAKLQDMELEIVHQLTDAVQDLDADYRSLLTNFSRRVAAEQQVSALEASYLAGTSSLDQLLDAQRRQSDANIAYYQALVNYNLSMVNIQMRKGTLLEYNGVQLAEGPWPAKAYFDAANRARQRDASHFLDYGFSRPKVISRGPISGKCASAIQPATFTDDPYASLPENVEYEDSDAEPTPADNANDGNDSLDDALDDAIDSMTDGERSKSKPPSQSDLPDVPEPKRVEPRPEPTPREALPEPDLLNDDLEAARPRRTAKRTTQRFGRKTIKSTRAQTEIKWKE